MQVIACQLNACWWREYSSTTKAFYLEYLQWAVKCRTETEDRKGKGKDLQVSEHLGLLLIKWGTLSAPHWGVCLHLGGEAQDYKIERKNFKELLLLHTGAWQVKKIKEPQQQRECVEEVLSKRVGKLQGWHQEGIWKSLRITLKSWLLRFLYVIPHAVVGGCPALL